MSASERHLPLTKVLVEFAETLGTDFSVQRILEHLVKRIVDILPVTGAGVMLMGKGQELHFVAASNSTVLEIETLQNELTEGPCLDAYRSGELVSVPDLSVDTRFARFSPRALVQGLAAVFTFPLRLRDHRLGALDLYRDVAGELTEEDLDTAQILANVAAGYLVNAQARQDAADTQAQLRRLSLHDPLTGLPNRSLLVELLDRAVERARRSHHVAAVLFIDLDAFKSINDMYGHHVGDELLVAVAGRLTTLLRPGDALCRMGGDEFVALCEDMDSAADAEVIAGRITSALARPFPLPSLTVTVSGSVGIAFSGPGQDIPVILRNADFAMYQAKNDGGGRYRVSDPNARLAADRRNRLDVDLRHSQARGELYLAYQPIIALSTGRLAAVEALLRWNHPVRGLVMPTVVIPSAERTGMIVPLGEWVLRQACRDLVQWRRDGLVIPKLAVNVSAGQVMGPAFAQTVAAVLGDTGADPTALCLEVTESLFLGDTERAAGVMNEIKDLGVQLSLDDFGTGYSSLTYLQSFPVDIVKIDRSFTAKIANSKSTRSIVHAVIDLSHVLDMTVVAEGVETPDDLERITQMGADYGQGFHFSKPIPGKDFRVYAAAAFA